MKQTETAIVGASASGLFTALLVAAQGTEVTVFERAGELKPAARSLIVTDQFQELVGDVARACIVNEVREFQLHADGRSVVVPLARPDWIIERAALIRDLAARATEVGVRVSFSHRFVGLDVEAGYLTLSFEERRMRSIRAVRTPVVVGADGANSKVAVTAGWKRQPTVSLAQAIVETRGRLSPTTAVVWFRPEQTPFFFWLIPESKTRGALGVIADGPADSARQLKRFLHDLPFRPVEFQAARIPRYERWVALHRKMRGARAYLVGDAAGHVKVTTVGGIVTGFRGAARVAEAIVMGDGAPSSLGLRLELDTHLLVRRFLNNFTDEDYGQLLDLLGTRSRSVLASRDRDLPAQLLVNLILANPRLLGVAARAMMRRH